MSSHAQQRASTVQLFASAAPSASPFGATTGCSPAASMGSPFGGFGQQQGSPFGFWPSAGASSPSPFGELPVTAAAPPPAPRFGFSFATPAMQSMVESSRKTREQQQSEPGGSPFGPNSSGRTEVEECRPKQNWRQEVPGLGARRSSSGRQKESWRQIGKLALAQGRREWKRPEKIHCRGR
ncbi:uncharacterized protein C2845_PM07G28800 [Panicum miliaceum]|uniref:Uncharacterized protein n=1 Tax=Panicum miliaceum TaxID=4540 RepID=A0A3L6SPV8_PANMI|nr:uncharacterized protein C2845_PM07G28800 [Panicum miliaceum]